MFTVREFFKEFWLICKTIQHADLCFKMTNGYLECIPRIEILGICYLMFTVSQFLRSYETLYRWHLLGIGQTKIIYYNLPDTTILEKLKRNWFLLNMYQSWLYLPIINSILRVFCFWLHWIWYFDPFSEIMCGNSCVQNGVPLLNNILYKDGHIW